MALWGSGIIWDILQLIHFLGMQLEEKAIWIWDDNIYVDKYLSHHCADDMNPLAEGK
jgi:hypothetical protein